jgi:hypothetical protein
VTDTAHWTRLTFLQNWLQNKGCTYLTGGHCICLSQTSSSMLCTFHIQQLSVCTPPCCSVCSAGLAGDVASLSSRVGRCTEPAYWHVTCVIACMATTLSEGPAIYYVIAIRMSLVATTGRLGCTTPLQGCSEDAVSCQMLQMLLPFPHSWSIDAAMQVQLGCVAETPHYQQ